MECYLAELERGELQPDAAQRRAVEYTQRLYEKLVQGAERKSGLVERVRGLLGGAGAEPVRGLYLWGGVGRGKTHIVNALPARVRVLLLGNDLDAFTLLIGSIAIGLAVDDTIHFMHNFRRYYQRSGDIRESVRETLASTGQALLFTSLVLSTGFFLYMMASMRVLFYFGLLTGFTIIVAFLADVILAPALMALAVRPRSVRTLDTEMSR